MDFLATPDVGPLLFVGLTAASFATVIEFDAFSAANRFSLRINSGQVRRKTLWCCYSIPAATKVRLPSGEARKPRNALAASTELALVRSAAP